MKDIRYFGIDDKPHGLVYVPHSQDSWRSLLLVVNTDKDAASYTGAIRAAIANVDKNVAVADIKTTKKIIEESFASQRFTMMLFTIFSAVAMLLSIVGIYGVMTYNVAQRRHEIGIRIALGARPIDVLKMILGQGIWLTTIGNAIGICVALAITRLLSNLLYEISEHDLITYCGVLLLFSLVALISCYLPAQKAMKVDPIITIRAE